MEEKICKRIKGYLLSNKLKLQNLLGNNFMLGELKLVNLIFNSCYRKNFDN